MSKYKSIFTIDLYLATILATCEDLNIIFSSIDPIVDVILHLDTRIKKNSFDRVIVIGIRLYLTIKYLV